METPGQYSLYGILHTLYRHAKIIIILTVLSGLTGLVMALVKKKKYEAHTEFFLKSPFYADRNFLFNNDTKFIDYFANEDDVNRLVTLTNSDKVQEHIIREFNLARIYKFDTTDSKDRYDLKKFVTANIAIGRSTSKTVTLAYTDKDPVRAAKIANRTVKLLEEELRSFYNETRMSMHESIMIKVREEDSMVNVLTDTLIKLREKYGIYDIISPSRSGTIMGTVKPSGKPDFAEGIELIQNLGSLKDNAVSMRTWHLSLAHQYTTGTKLNELPLTKIISIAEPPVKAKGPGKMICTLVGAFVGFGFGVLYVLATIGYKRMKAA